MSVRLRDLIKAVRAAKTAAQERAIIQKEAALIRTEFGKGTAENRQRNIAKLLYMNTLGYPTKWGQMECIKLIASHDYMDKRIGYLAINMLLDENQEVLMLATHQIKTDLRHHQRFVAGLALVTLGNIASEQICRDCACDIEQLLVEQDIVPYRRKKAVLCALKIIRKVPDLAEQFVPSIKSLLQDSDHGVLLCTATLMIELCNIEGAEFKKVFQDKYVPALVRILKNVHKAGYAPEYDVGGISDPFLQVKLLRLLRVLGEDSQAASDRMNETLAMIATNTDTLRNVGNAILYECVTTIMSIKSDQDLRVMAINTLGKFLSNKDNNIRYVALFSLCKVVDGDTEVVQRDRGKIVDCLKDPDRSIRRRALHLIYSLVDEQNVRNLVRELLAVLVKADVEFRSDLTAKLCYVSEKFAPNQRWLLDTVMKVMSTAGEYVPEQVQYNLIGTITRTPSLQVYAVQKFYLALLESTSQPVLNQVAVWCMGEYGDLLVSQPVSETGSPVDPNDILSVIYKVMTAPGTSVLIQQYSLTALFKLSDRLGQNAESRIKSIFDEYKTNVNLELQRRACEYAEFFALAPPKRKIILEQIPPLAAQAPESGVKLVPVGDEPAPTPVVAAGDSGATFDPLAGLFGFGGTPTQGTTGADPLAPSDTTSQILKLFDTSTTSPVAPTPFGGFDFGAMNMGANVGATNVGGMNMNLGVPMTNALPLGNFGMSPLGASPVGVPAFGQPTTNTSPAVNQIPLGGLF